MAPTDTSDPSARPPTMRPVRPAMPRWLQHRLLVASDCVGVLVGWLAVLGVVWSTRASSSGVGWLLTATVITMGVLSHEQVYSTRVRAVRAIEVQHVWRACLIAALVLGGVDWLVGSPLGIGVVLAGTGAAGVALVASRTAFSALLHDGRRRSERGTSLLLIGTPDAARRVLALLGARPDLGYRVLGYVSPQHSTDDIGVPWLGRPDDLGVLADLTAVTAVLVVPDGLDTDVLDAAMATLRDMNVHVHVVIDDATRQPQIRLLPGARPALDRQPQLTTLQQLAKRAFDVSVGSVLALIALPIVALAAAALRVTVGAPVLVYDLHVGPTGDPLRVPRLRTRDLPDSAAARRIARLCRALSVDELPQLGNVVTGSMSLVGPRPQRTHQRGSSAPPPDGVHAGLIGLRHVEARDYPEAGPHRRREAFYAENWSVGLDISIVAASVVHLLWRAMRLVFGQDSGGPTAAVT